MPGWIERRVQLVTDALRQDAAGWSLLDDLLSESGRRVGAASVDELAPRVVPAARRCLETWSRLAQESAQEAGAVGAGLVRAQHDFGRVDQARADAFVGGADLPERLGRPR